MHNLRTAVEGYAALSWLLAFGIMAYFSIEADWVKGPLWWMTGICMTFFVYRLVQMFRVLQERNALSGKDIEWITTQEVVKKMAKRPDQLWLGWGFDWKREHAQKMYDLDKVNIEDLKPPLLYTKLTGNKLWEKPKEKGLGSIHGVEHREKDIYVPLKSFDGHTFVCATTGAIKTRLLSLVVCQAIHRNPKEAVIVIDPKGDKELMEMMKIECERAGRADDFAYFHPAFPQASIRIDPLKNWNRPTELASRIASLIPGDSAGDVFTSFGWRAINLVAEGLIFVSENPSLKTLKRYVESGSDDLLGKTIIRHMENLSMNVEEAIEPYRQQVNVGKIKKPAPGTPVEVVALAACYKQEIAEKHNSTVVDGLLSMFEHNREHMGKMLATLIPILTMLTAGEVGDLLSPDRNNVDDLRAILDTEKIVSSNKVVYMGLDSLTDATVSSAMGSIILADLVAVAGARYNYGGYENVVNLFNDECNETVNVPTLQMANKSRGAGFRLMFLTQTVPDLIVRLGSDAQAMQFLGNCNNTIVGRSLDPATKLYLAEVFKKTTIETIQETKTTNAKSGEGPAQYNASYGARTTDTEADLVASDIFNQIPDLEYYAVWSAGKTVKGRIPLIKY